MESYLATATKSKMILKALSNLNNSMIPPLLQRKSDSEKTGKGLKRHLPLPLLEEKCCGRSLHQTFGPDRSGKILFNTEVHST